MKKVLIIILAVVVILTVAFFGMRFFTKSHSPYSENSLAGVATVKYSSPFKNGREIFGALVPFGEVWRTGANEATLLLLEKAITINNQVIEPGEYSLWTIPGETEWVVILNTQTGQWGINMSGEANKEASNDVVEISVPVIQTKKEFEQLTITFESVKEGNELIIAWDKTMVAVPFTE